MTTEQWLFAGFGIFIMIFLIIDLGIFQKKAHIVSFKSALWQTVFWWSVTSVFGVLIYFLRSKEEALQFGAAYLMEESLSVDNMFVFVLIFQYFKIPERLFHKVLFYGVLGAIIFRAVFISVGVVLVTEFHWILYVFGGILIVTGAKMLFSNKNEKFEPEKNIIYRLLTKNFRFTHDAPEDKFYIRRNGKTYLTTLFLVVCLIETTDILFALDSIPAVFAISQNQFVIYTSNIFAVMGLRALFFLLIGIISKFHFLQQGISFILMFIGTKMILEIFNFHLPIQFSLAVIVMMLASSMIMSLIIPDKNKN